MRIGILCDDYDVYQEEVESLRKRLVEEGKEVTLIISGKKFEEKDDRIIVPFLSPSKKLGVFLNRIQNQPYYEKLKKIPFDILHSYSYGGLTLLALSIANHRSIPFLFSFRIRDFQNPKRASEEGDYFTSKQISIILQSILAYDGTILSGTKGREYLRGLGFTNLILSDITEEERMLTYEKIINRSF